MDQISMALVATKETETEKASYAGTPSFLKKHDIFRLLAALLLLCALDVFLFQSHGRIVPEDLYTTLTGFNEDGSYSLEGTEGAYIYGPYRAYKKGRYVLSFFGAEEGSGSTFDVYAQGITYLSGEFKGSGKYSVELDENVDALEIRIFYHGEGSVRLDKLYFRLQLDWGFYFAMLLLQGVWVGLVWLWLRRGKAWYTAILTVLFTVPLHTFFMEYVMRGSTLSAFDFLRGDSFAFLIECLPFLLLGIGLWAFVHNIRLALLPGQVIQWVFCLVQINYERLRGDPFQLSDLQLAGDAMDVFNNFDYIIPVGFVIIVLCFLLGLFSIPGGTKNIKRSWKDWITGSLCLLLSLSCGWNIASLIQLAGGEAEIYILKNFYTEYGYYTGMLRTRPRKPEAPENYSEKTIAALLEDVELSEASSALPDIIFIQEETLFDLALMQEPSWSEDPLAALKEYQALYTYGYMLSPVSGGGTCNVEFEVLTGYPFMNTIGTPYNDQIYEGMSSLISILNELNYDTVSMHFNTASFFNRNNVYAALEFHRSIFLEDVTYSSEDLINGWISDAFTFEALIADYEARDPTRPYFSLVVTTQNHGAYLEEYDAHGIIAQKTGNQEDEQRQLQSYLNEERESCEQIVRLLDYFKTVERPTIVVIWGDHCPSISLLGIENRREEWFEHLTPLLVFNNFGLEREELGVVAAYNLTPYILSLLDVRTDLFMTWSMDHSLPNVLGVMEILSLDDVRLTSDWTETEQKLWSDLWLLQYDRMYGEKYST